MHGICYPSCTVSINGHDCTTVYALLQAFKNRINHNIRVLTPLVNYRIQLKMPTVLHLLVSQSRCNILLYVIFYLNFFFCNQECVRDHLIKNRFLFIRKKWIKHFYLRDTNIILASGHLCWPYTHEVLLTEKKVRFRSLLTQNTVIS